MRSRLSIAVLTLMPFAALAGATLVAAPNPEDGSAVFLPGTQPGEGGIEFAKVQQCLMCHSRTANGDADPYFSWRGGMMAQSARDPVYRASLAIANQDVPGAGELCWRCHAPRGWLEGRGTADGSLLNSEDLEGISCDLCHRLVDPLSEEAAGLVEHQPPGRGNAMMVADTQNVVRGPYGDGTGAMPHRVMKSDYHASSELCGNCHNVSNPLLADDPATQAPHEYGHLDRTYSEWLLSDFPAMGAEGTCQSCHYEPVEGGGKASRFGGRTRAHFVGHGPVGGSTWVQDAVVEIWGNAVDAKALAAGKERSRAMLRRAAELKVEEAGPERAVVRITNKTGHKLPTGFPEGRRMWVNATFVDAGGAVLGEIGRYGERDDTLRGEPVRVPTLLDPGATRVYECLPGMSEQQAAKHGKKPGKSFHVLLNDIITKDNRIPPKGFDNAKFASHLSAPVGATYADGQHWDDVALELPAGTARVTVRLMFQSVSWEYMKFLVDENRTDDWGTKLHDAWLVTGKCAPEAIAELTFDVTGPGE